MAFLNMETNLKELCNIKRQIQQTVPDGVLDAGPQPINCSVSLSDVIQIKHRNDEGTRPLFDREDIVVNQPLENNSSNEHQEKRNITNSDGNVKGSRGLSSSGTSSSSPVRYRDSVKRKSSPTVPKRNTSPDKKAPYKPYFTDKNRERDRLRRLYGSDSRKSRSQSPRYSRKSSPPRRTPRSERRSRDHRRSLSRERSHRDRRGSLSRERSHRGSLSREINHRDSSSHRRPRYSPRPPEYHHRSKSRRGSRERSKKSAYDDNEVIAIPIQIEESYTVPMSTCFIPPHGAWGPPPPHRLPLPQRHPPPQRLPWPGHYSTCPIIGPPTYGMPCYTIMGNPPSYNTQAPTRMQWYASKPPNVNNRRQR